MYMVSIKLHSKSHWPVYRSSKQSGRCTSKAYIRSPQNPKTWSAILSSGTMIYDTVLYTIRPITGYANSSRATSEREPSVSRSPITPVIEVVLSKISLRGQKWGQRRFTTLIIDRVIRLSAWSFRSSPLLCHREKKRKKKKKNPSNEFLLFINNLFRSFV